MHRSSTSLVQIANGKLAARQCPSFVTVYSGEPLCKAQQYRSKLIRAVTELVTKEILTHLPYTQEVDVCFGNLVGEFKELGHTPRPSNFPR